MAAITPQQLLATANNVVNYVTTRNHQLRTNRLRTFFQNTLQITNNLTQQQIYQAVRRNDVRDRVVNALTALGEGGVALINQLDDFFGGDHDNDEIGFPPGLQSALAVMMAIKTTMGHVLYEEGDYRFLMFLRGNTPDGHPISIVRPVNQDFVTYANNALWTYFTGVAIEDEEQYDADDWADLLNWINIQITIRRIQRFPQDHDQGGGSFWKYWLDERFPTDLSKYQVYKESERKSMFQIGEKENTIQISDDEFAEPDCLGYALMWHDLPDSILRRYFETNAMNTSPFFPTLKLRGLAASLGINLRVTSYYKGSFSDMPNGAKKWTCGKQNTVSYYGVANPPKTMACIPGEDAARWIDIGRYDGHYFVDEHTGWTLGGLLNFLSGWKWIGDERARLVPKENWKLFNYRRVSARTGENYLAWPQNPQPVQKTLRTGQLLRYLVEGKPVILKEGDALIRGDKIGPLMSKMSADDFQLKTEFFLHFKNIFAKQDLPKFDVPEEFVEYADGLSRDYECSGQQQFRLSDGSFPGQHELRIIGSTLVGNPQTYPGREITETAQYKYFNDALFKGKAKIESLDDWSFPDRFGIKAYREIRRKKDGKFVKSRVDFFVPMMYTMIVIDFETYVDPDDEHVHIPYLVSVGYYENSNLTDKAFDWRLLADLSTAGGQTVESLGGVFKKRSFFGPDCANDLVKFLIRSPIFSDVYIGILAHNMKYDLSMLMRNSSIRVIEGIFKTASKANCALLSLRTIESGHRGSRFAYMLDTYSITGMALREFRTSFKLKDVKKEIMPYTYYNKGTVVNGMYGRPHYWIPLIDWADHLPNGKADIGEVLKNAPHHLIRRRNVVEVDAIGYAKFYCEQDCATTMAGFCIHRSNCFNMETPNGQPCRLDMKDCVSIPQYASHYMGKSGTFAGVKQFCGTLRNYISRAIVGGRSMVRGNLPHAERFTEIDDFDACSLYPTGMHRMGSEEFGHQGLPVGLPKLWTSNIDLKDPSLAQYFITVRITKVGVYRKFPLFPSDKATGGRHWTNDVVGKVFVFDKVQWEDAQEFQKAEGEIICGLYFDGGGNPIIKDVMDFLYKRRQELKKEKNVAQIVCKLIMNSGYGRMIMKAVDKETVFVYGKKNILHALHRFHHTIKDVGVMRDYVLTDNEIIAADNDRDDACYVIQKAKATFDHYSIPHCGAFVLSESKRVMNEVMCLAEDIGVVINYQDTDSMHMKKEYIPKLGEAFDAKYGHRTTRGLVCGANGVPEALGRFHSDFAGKIATRDEKGEPLCREPHATDSYFVGKKMYFDKLVQRGVGAYVGIRGIVFHHLRMKGVNDRAVEKFAVQAVKDANLYPPFSNNCVYGSLPNGATTLPSSSYGFDGKPIQLSIEDLYTMQQTSNSVEQLYQALLEGYKFSFDLSIGKPCFKSTHDGRVVTQQKFERKVGINQQDLRLALDEWDRFFPEDPYPKPDLREITLLRVTEADGEVTPYANQNNLILSPTEASLPLSNSVGDNNDGVGWVFSAKRKRDDWIPDDDPPVGLDYFYVRNVRARMSNEE